MNAGEATDAFAFDPQPGRGTLPRAYQWCDGSAFLSHGALMQKKAFNLEPIDGVEHTPLIYPGAGDDFDWPTRRHCAAEREPGIDFEGEFVGAGG